MIRPPSHGGFFCLADKTFESRPSKFAWSLRGLQASPWAAKAVVLLSKISCGPFIVEVKFGDFTLGLRSQPATFEGGVECEGLRSGSSWWQGSGGLLIGVVPVALAQPSNHSLGLGK